MKNVNGMTRDELRAEAKELQIPGRGSMKAQELREAVAYFREEAIREQARIVRADRYRDQVKRGELKVRTPNGQAPDIFLSPVASARRTPRSVPMSVKTRVMHYVKQNGIHELTARQARQIRRTERRLAPTR